MAVSGPNWPAMPVSTTTEKLVIEVLIKPGTPTLRISANSAHRGICPRKFKRMIEWDERR